MKSRAISAAAVVAAFSFLAGLGCKPKEVVITRDDTLAKEDEAIKDLQTKVVERQKELDTLERERLKEATKLSEEQRQKREEAIRKYEEFLGKYPISPYTPDVLIALGELYLERSEEENANDLDVYQKKLEESQANGTEFTEPEPQAHYEKTIAAYQQIALKYKDFPYADVAYYGLGYCLKAQGEDKEAAETFYKLTQQYPQSKFISECYYRIGDYFFDQYEFDKAVKYYALVPPENPDFYDKALYKMGWSYYNQGDIGVSSVEYQKAIDAFTKLIETSQQLSVLTSEAKEFTAISLTEWSSDPNDETAVSKALSHYGESFRAGGEKEYSPDILQELGNVYLYKQDKLKAAATTYETLLQYYPNYARAPEVLDALVECYLRQEDYEGAHKTRVRIVDGYGPTSKWYEIQEDLDTRHKALQRWENALYEVAVYYNTQAERKAKAKPEEAKPLFQEAINRYTQYLAAFPTNNKAYHVNFYLASSYDAVGDYANAGDQYQKTALGYGDRERYSIDKWDEKFTQKDSLFNAIVAYDLIFQKDKEANKPAPTEFTPPPANAESNGVQPMGPIERPVKPLTLDEANLIRACNAFTDRYPEGEEIPQVLSKLGEVYFYVEDYDRARQSFEKLVTQYPQASKPDLQKDHDMLVVSAAESVANSYFNEAQFYEKNGRWAEAGEKYGEAKKWYARTEREAKDRNVMDTMDRAKKLAGATGIKTAEMMGAGVTVAPIEEPTIAPEVAVEKEGTEDFTVLFPPLPPIEAQAFSAKSAEAKAYEDNYADNQGTDVGQLSLGNAAETYYKIRDWDNAARVYMQYTKAYPQAGDLTKMAYTKAAECYERKQDWANAGKVYLEIADHPQYKGTTPLGRDSLFRAGLMYEQQKNWDKTAEVFGRFITEYPEEAKPRLEATFRMARAQEKMGRTSDALENFKVVAAIYKAGKTQGLDMAGTEKYAAEALFKYTDTKFDEYDKIQFTMPQKVMEANLKKKMEEFQNLGAYYLEVAGFGIPKWQVAAHCRTADLCVSFRDSLRNAEVPEELRPEYWEALPDEDQRKPLLEDAYNKYTEALENQALPLEDKAVAEYTEASNVAEANGIDDEWSRKAHKQLLLIRPTEVVKYEDVGNKGLKSDTSWLVSNAPAEGWLDLKYDDNAWPTASTSSWRQKDDLQVLEQVPGDVATIWGGAVDNTVYFRKKISFTYDPGQYDAVIQTNGMYKLYVNGTLIGQTDPLVQDPWVRFDAYDVSSALQLGDNVICVEVTRIRDDSYGLRFALVPEGGFPSEAPPPSETGVPDEFPTPGETGVPGEEFGGGAMPEEGGLPEEELTPPGEGGEAPSETPPAEVAPSETPPAEGGETPAETPPAGETPAGDGEALPAPTGGESTSGSTDTSGGGDIDFGATGTPDETGGGDVGTEEPAPGGGEF